MRQSRHVLFPILPSLVLCSWTWAGQPTVTNHGFEQPVMNLCGFGAAPLGWTLEGNAGVWRPGTGQCLNSYPAGPPEGAQVGFTNAGPMSQTLTANLEANTQYTLSVKVGRRLDCCQQTTYRVQLWAGGTMLFEDPGLLALTPGTFITSRVYFGAAPGHAAIGQLLQIRLVRGASGQGNFDDVHLDAAPADCNNNGVFDAIDISNGTLPDVNANGVPDGCEIIPCPPDVAPSGGDGVVNVNDLLAVIGNWGAVGPNLADINHDNVVNVNDLLAVVGAWGPCA